MRIAKIPSSGRTVASGSSHLGPPTAPNRIASDLVAEFNSLVRQRSAEVVNGVSADSASFQVERVAEASADCIQNFDGLGDYLRSNAISWQDGYLVFHRVDNISLVCIGGAPRVLYRQITMKGLLPWQ